MYRNSSDQGRQASISLEKQVAAIEQSFNQSWYDESIDAIDKLLSTSIPDQTRTSLLCRKALCFVRLFKFEQAEETLLEALKVPVEIDSSSHRTITAQLAYLYGDWANSYVENPDKKKYYQDLCLEWIECCFRNGEKRRHFLYNSMGDIMCDRENYKDALKAYNQAIRIQPKDFWVYRSLANVNFKLQNFAKSIKYYDQAIRALEEESSTSQKSDSVKLKTLANIEKMKENRERAREFLSAAKTEKQVLLVCKEEAQTAKIVEEEETTTTSSQKEAVSIHSFEFPDLVVDVPRFIRAGGATIQLKLKEISKNNQFEIIRLNDEGACHIIHAATGLALTVDKSDGIKFSPLESKQILANQTWRVETQKDGASTIISNVNKKKLCAIYDNDKLRFLTKKMKLNEAGKLTLQDSVKDGIDLWRLSSINKL